MRILIVGNMGYVGSELVSHLRRSRPHATIDGFDNAYFAHCLTGALRLPECRLDRQYYGDVRDVDFRLLTGYDAVIQLAALSNDPIGDRFASLTKEINQNSALTFASEASRRGVRNFVFASSCSVYGVTEGGARKESDPLNPITAYAKSKIGSELGLKELEGGMVVTCLRFATACGMSDRLRLDLVLNDYVACALSEKKITVLSDGTPWRPLIDVHDMARAIDWAVDRPKDHGGRFLTVNAGAETSNYQVVQLAEAVASAIPGTAISINHDAPVDSRSYKADFSLYRELAPFHQPELSLRDSIERLIDGLSRMRFDDRMFRSSDLIRLNVLKKHIDQRRLSEQLTWMDGGSRPEQPDMLVDV